MILFCHFAKVSMTAGLAAWADAPSYDGSTTVHFRDCYDGRMTCLPIMEGETYVVQLFQFCNAILEGRWTFPPCRPIN